jgi:hypothetical protein
MAHAKSWSKRVGDGSNKAQLADMILRYVNWLPMNPETNSVAKLYMKQVSLYPLFLQVFPITESHMQQLILFIVCCVFFLSLIHTHMIKTHRAWLDLFAPSSQPRSAVAGSCFQELH